MNRREDLLQQAKREPENLVDQLLQLETRVTEQAETIAEQNALIEQLKRMLFGPKSEKLTDEQAEQLAEVAHDLQEQAERPAPDSDAILEAEGDDAPKQKKKRGGRHPLPAHLEVQTTVLEPAQANCEYCGQLGQEIGRETSEQIDLIPAKLILRRTVRIKRRCQCGCGKIAIAPLPPGIDPLQQTGPGLGRVHSPFQV